MTGKERLSAVLNHRLPDRIPTFEWFIDSKVGEALTGSSDILDIVEKLDLDGINIRADYSSQTGENGVFTDEWGFEKKWTAEVLPVISRHPLEDIRDHKNYKFPDPGASDRFNTIERAVKRFGDTKGIILNVRDGFSDMRDLLGYENALMGIYLEPEAFTSLLDRVVDYNIALADIAKKRYGLEIVATTDDIATADAMIINPEVYMEFIGPAFKKAVQGFEDLGFKHIKHCDGKIDEVIDFWIDCGIDAIDPVDPAAGYTMAGFREKYGDNLCLKGNVDCRGALISGTPKDVALETKICLESGKRGSMILSSSNTIHSGVKPENYMAMLDTVKNFQLKAES